MVCNELPANPPPPSPRAPEPVFTIWANVMLRVHHPRLCNPQVYLRREEKDVQSTALVLNYGNLGHLNLENPIQHLGITEAWIYYTELRYPHRNQILL